MLEEDFFLSLELLIEFFFLSPGFFADDKSTAQAEFLKAASALRDQYRFAHSNAEALLQSQDIEAE